MKIKEDNKKNYLEQQGITLIALVVTIIVLLILAAVTISAVFGENGLLKSIEIAREKTEIAEYKEDLNQKLLEAKINVLVDDSKVLEETRKIILRDKKYDGAVVSEVEDNKFTVITKEGYKFEVTPDGAEYIEKTSGTIEGNKGSIVMTSAVEGAKANITFELKGKKDIEQWATEWLEKYTADKTEADLEADVVKAYNKNNNTTYENFDDLLTAEGKTRDDLKKIAENDGISYKSLLFIQSGGEGAFLELYFTYILDLSGTETDYNKQLEIINDTDKLKEKVVQILECNSFEELLAEHNLTEESLEQKMQESNATYNQVLCALAVAFYQPITVNVSNGDSFKVSFTDIMDSKPYKYTSSEVGTLTFVATGPQGMTGSIDIEFIGDSTSDLPSTSYTIPYYPDNTFTKVEGTNLSNGLVIQDGNGNEYVWIEVPKTTGVYPTAGLEITNFTEAEYTAIETDLHTYTNYYRDGTKFTDTYYSDETTGLTSSQYTELKQKMLKSVYKNGGFWIGKYEAGIETNRTSNTIDLATAPTPLSKQGTVENSVYPYTYVTCSQAQTVASKLSTENYTSSLMFGVQWDLVLKHIEVKAVEQGTELVTIQSALRSDSKDWGNYIDASFKINRGKYADYISSKLSTTWTPYNQTTSNNFVDSNSVKQVQSSGGDGILLTTGASDECKKMNIYDLAGNVGEWTLEYTADTLYPCACRGGACNEIIYDIPVSIRPYGSTTTSGGAVGFRVSLFK